MASIEKAAARSAASKTNELAQTLGVQPQATQAIALYRLPQVLSRIPVSRSSWFAGIQAGRYPRGHQLGPRTTVWRSDDIERLIARFAPGLADLAGQYQS